MDKDKESRKQPFQICLSVILADGKMSLKRNEISSYLVHNIFRLGKMTGMGKMAGKTEPIHGDKLNMNLVKF